ncbi:hypothetical protein BP6252_10351 [Coleophoma cylindrospora]|uniref:Chromo domain-containing protein n=1 Tax=Coleophoma cylindrospora TaxID=1849047 RepID=A0A3D8QST1_9HELO|nr:hypothetical protein BP6252_10351 [Coleophoma cylindrospora]
MSRLEDQQRRKKHKNVQNIINNNNTPTILQCSFDFTVRERVKYIPGSSGPPLAPISIMPVHDKDGIILDYMLVNGGPHYLIGYADSRLQVIAKPQHILDWVSRRTFEDYEYEQTTLRLRQEEEELLPQIIAKEERRRKREEKLTASRAEGPKKTWSRKRKRPPTPEPAPRKEGGRARGLGARLSPSEGLGTSGPARTRRKVKPEPTFVSPRRISHPQPQQPSLTTPVKGKGRTHGDVISIDSESEETDTAISRQLGLTSHGRSRQSDSPSADLSHTETPPKQKGSHAVQKPEQKKSAYKPGSITQKYSMFARSPQKPTACKPGSIAQKYSMFAKSPQKPTGFQNVIVSSHESDADDKEENHSEIDEAPLAEGEEEEEYEVKAILEEEYRKVEGKKVLYYLIDWEGDYRPTWEPSSMVGAGTRMEWEKKKKKKRKKKTVEKHDEKNTKNSQKSNQLSHNGKDRGRSKENDMKNSDAGSKSGSGPEFEASDQDTLFVSEKPVFSRGSNARGNIEHGNKSSSHSRGTPKPYPAATSNHMDIDNGISNEDEDEETYGNEIARHLHDPQGSSPERSPSEMAVEDEDRAEAQPDTEIYDHEHGESPEVWYEY